MSDVTDEMRSVMREALAGIVDDHISECSPCLRDEVIDNALTAVAPLIAAAEREACAKLAEGEQFGGLPNWRVWAWNNTAGKMADLIAAAIRARGTP